MANRSAGKKVLIVDDEPQIRDVLKRYLVKAGYEVVGESTDGEDAIGKTGRLQPDFVLLDNEMPVLSGEDAAGRIRAASSKTRIVAVSGSLTSRPAWSDAFLSKTGLAMVGELLDLIE
jgi:CheY-like chemotaxis protein